MGDKREIVTSVTASSDLQSLLWRIHREKGAKSFDIVVVGKEPSVKILEKMREALLNNHVFHVRVYVAAPGDAGDIVDKLSNRGDCDHLIVVNADAEETSTKQSGGGY